MSPKPSKFRGCGGGMGRCAAALLGALWLIVPLQLSADALSELPPAWRDQLRPVPEADVSGTEPVAREAITGTRERLAGLLQEAGTASDNLADGYGKLGALYQLFNVDSAAGLCWENAGTLQPAEFRWRYYAAYLAQTTGQTDKALQLYQRARELKPDYAPLNLRLGQLWLDTDQLDKGQAALEAAAGEPGLRAAALYYLGRIELLKRDYQGAVDHLSESLSLDPAATGVHYPLAQAYRHLGKEVLAREHLGQFEAKLPAAEDPLVGELEGVLQTARRHFGRALKAVMERDYEAAIAQFRQGLEIDPDNLDARVSYARALYLAGQTEAAEQQLNAVLARQPDQSLANFFLALMREAQGQPAQAAERYRIILQHDQQHEGAHYYLANLLFKNKQYQEAGEQYRAALAASGDIPPARLLELVALHRAGQPERDTLRELERRVRDYPDQPELKYALARLRSLSKDPQIRDSVEALTLANQLAPNQPTPPNIAVLALAAAADGQFDQAASLQQQLVDMVGWMAPPGELQGLQETLDEYKEGIMPKQPVWPLDDPLLSPRPLNPDEPFRDYPAAVPF